MNPDVEQKLLDYLAKQERADVVGALHRILEAFQAHEAKDEQRHLELRGDYRGLSLRVGQLEAKHPEKVAKKKIFEWVHTAAIAILSTSLAWFLGKWK